MGFAFQVSPATEGTLRHGCALPGLALLCPVLACPALSCPVLPCPALPTSWPALPSPSQPSSAQRSPTLPCLPFPALPCPPRPALAWPCLGLPFPTLPWTHAELFFVNIGWHQKQEACSITSVLTTATSDAGAQLRPGTEHETQPAVTASGAQDSGFQQCQVHPPASNDFEAVTQGNRLIPSLPLVRPYPPSRLSVPSHAVVNGNSTAAAAEVH